MMTKHPLLDPAFQRVIAEQERIQRLTKDFLGGEPIGRLAEISSQQREYERIRRFQREIELLRNTQAPFKAYAELLNTQISATKNLWNDVDRVLRPYIEQQALINQAIDPLRSLRIAVEQALTIAEFANRAASANAFLRGLDPNVIASMGANLDAALHEIEEWKDEAQDNPTRAQRARIAVIAFSILLPIGDFVHSVWSDIQTDQHLEEISDQVRATHIAVTELNDKFQDVLPRLAVIEEKLKQTVGADGTFVLTTDVRLRTGPSTENGTITVVPKGTRFQVTVSHEGWCGGFVVSDDEQPVAGWIKNEFLVPAIRTRPDG